jgi:hypothetical protein
VQRFNKEDLRIPIAQDNAKDDAELKEYLEAVDVPGLLDRIKELAMDAVDAQAGSEADRAARFSAFASQWAEESTDEGTQIKEEDEEEQSGLYSEEVDEGEDQSGDGAEVEDVEMESEE